MRRIRKNFIHDILYILSCDLEMIRLPSSDYAWNMLKKSESKIAKLIEMIDKEDYYEDDQYDV